MTLARLPFSSLLFFFFNPFALGDSITGKRVFVFFLSSLFFISDMRARA